VDFGIGHVWVYSAICELDYEVDSATSIHLLVQPLRQLLETNDENMERDKGKRERGV
jgi:hypothetical protein